MKIRIIKKTISFLLVVITLMMFSSFFAFSAISSGPVAETRQQVEHKPTNALGDIILKTAQKEENASSDYYAIKSVVVKDTTAIVDVINLNACTLVVSIYDNDGIQMLGSGKVELSENNLAGNVPVEVDISIEEMPQHFYVKAFLLDDDYVPLCKNFVSREYTLEFEEFLSKTTEDFDEDIVINLDDSKDNNFLVVSENVMLIENDVSENSVISGDYSSGKYIIENASKEIKNLKPGEVFYYRYGKETEEYIIAKVFDVEVDGDKVTIISEEADEITEYFQYIKIDIETTETTFDGHGMDKDITHEKGSQALMYADADVDISLSNSDRWIGAKKFKDGTELDFVFESEVSFSFKFYVDSNEFDDFVYYEAIFGYNANFDVTLEGEFDYLSLPLGIIGVNTGKAGIAVDVEFSLIVESTISASAQFSLFEGALGIAWGSDVGVINKSKAATADFVPKVKDEATLFIGFSLKPQIAAFEKVNISIEGRAGMELTATLPVFENDDSKQHSCSVCLDISVDLNTDCKYEMKILDWLNNETTIAEFNLHVADFYYSLDLGFGEGFCPNIYHKVEVIVKDSNNNSLSNAIINNAYETDENGKTVLYLNFGTHTLSISHNGIVTTEDVSILDEGKEVTVVLERTRSIIASGTDKNNFTWILYDDGEFYINGKGRTTSYSNGTESPWYEHRNGIRTIVIGDEVTGLGDYAFYDCDSLENIVFPDQSYFYLGTYYNFAYCDALKKVVLPDSVGYIGVSLFRGCSNLTYIDLGNSVSYIDEYAFDGCSSLEFVKIPKPVWAIANYAFQNCSRITVYYQGAKEDWSNITRGHRYSLYPKNIIYNCGMDKNIALMSISGEASNEIIESAVVGNSYVMLVVKDKESEDMLSSDNLLYIDQKVAYEKTLSFEFEIDDTITVYDIVLTTSDIDNHIHNYNKTTVKPTCTFEGYTIYECSVCEYSFKGNYITKLNHKLGEWHTHTEATCTSNGLDRINCENCCYYEEKIIRATGHSYSSVETVPTCTKAGYTTYTCTCGDTYTETIPATGHTFNGSACINCGYDKADECGCNCHASGIKKFFFNFILFFQKLFRKNAVCDCGMAHY